ncbi:hypothetical protein GCM10028806_05440 [Spirosoma terrae]|uniref:Uncharacterized protein n=1 Tax=Spirosoma terrae TaxID=1968276 RepID=A0A6L9L8F9_9BACT|nr:hypothetical protein [Spirosoma terrae]NDU96875.1 hypothetical protein [Spirosoma terrae]
MSSKIAVEEFVSSTAQWSARALHRLKCTRLLADYETTEALAVLGKHMRQLRDTTNSIAYMEQKGTTVHGWERLLDQLYYRQLKVNQTARLYEITPYPLAGNGHEPVKLDAVFSAWSNSMAPQILKGDSLKAKPIDRYHFMSTNGIVALAYRYNRTHPRTWLIGRVEPVQNRLLRLTQDNSLFGHMDRVFPLRQVVMMYKIEELTRHFA